MYPDHEFDVHEDQTPRLTGTITGYQLIDRLCQVIGEEPRRLNMEVWLDPVTVDDRTLTLNKDRLPECGTIGCAAGWMVVLTRGAESVTDLAHNHQAIKHRALDLVAPSPVRSEDSFNYYLLTETEREEYNTARNMRNELSSLFGTMPEAYHGTPEHAQETIVAIQAFQSAWADRLRAVTITIPDPPVQTDPPVQPVE